MANPAKKHVFLFYCAECEELAHKVAAQSDSITLQTIKWRSFPFPFPFPFPYSTISTNFFTAFFDFLLLVVYVLFFPPPFSRQSSSFTYSYLTITFRYLVSNLHSLQLLHFPLQLLSSCSCSTITILLLFITFSMSLLVSHSHSCWF